MPLFKHIKCLNVGLHVGEFVKEALKVIIVCLSKKRQRRLISTFILRFCEHKNIIFFKFIHSQMYVYDIYITWMCVC